MLQNVNKTNFEIRSEILLVCPFQLSNFSEIIACLSLSLSIVQKFADFQSNCYTNIEICIRLCLLKVMKVQGSLAILYTRNILKLSKNWPACTLSNLFRMREGLTETKKTPPFFCSYLALLGRYQKKNLDASEGGAHPCFFSFNLPTKPYKSKRTLGLSQFL